MKKISNGFEDYYYLQENGKVFNEKTGKVIEPNKKHMFSLKTKEGKYKSIVLKTLYFLVYNKVFCIDTIEDLQGEQWRKIQDSKDYYISNKARIKSYSSYNAIILQLYTTKKGYKRIDIISVDGFRHARFVHSLVAEAFIGSIPSKDYQVHHIDGNKQNNNVENLCYCSPL